MGKKGRKVVQQKVVKPPSMPMGIPQEVLMAEQERLARARASAVHVLPGAAVQPSEKPDNTRWVMVYPNYINSNKTVPEGRRIPRACACEDPIVEEISEVLRFLKLYHTIEMNKAYPRDWLIPGRVKVRIFDEEKRPIHSEITSRKALFRKLGQLIPQLKSRETRMQQATQTAKTAAISASTSTSNKKKGKKGRR